MQVVINIDSANFGSTVEDLFKSLTTEQKGEIAKDLIVKWLSEPSGFERAAYEQSLIDQVKAGTIKIGSSYDNVDWTKKDDNEIRGSYQFNDKMKGYKSSRERMIEDITSAASRTFSENITTLVKEDEQLKQKWEIVKEEIAKNFPAMVQSAMISYFIGNMQEIQTSMYNLRTNVDSLNYFKDNIQQKLNGGY